MSLRTKMDHAGFRSLSPPNATFRLRVALGSAGGCLKTEMLLLTMLLVRDELSRQDDQRRPAYKRQFSTKSPCLYLEDALNEVLSEPGWRVGPRMKWASSSSTPNTATCGRRSPSALGPRRSIVPASMT